MCKTRYVLRAHDAVLIASWIACDDISALASAKSLLAREGVSEGSLWATIDGEDEFVAMVGGKGEGR
jgi:hypothetical protein